MKSNFSTVGFPPVRKGTTVTRASLPVSEIAWAGCPCHRQVRSRLRHGIKSSLLLLLALAACLPALLADPLADARARFADGEFDKAVKLYEQSLEKSAPTAAVFYELGRAFGKTGNEARAALNFRRALVLDPRFAPAAAALKESNTALGISSTTPRWLDAVLTRVPMDALTIAGAGLFWLGAFVVLFAIRSGRGWRAAGGAVLVLAGLAALGLVWLSDPRISLRTEAIVLKTGGADMLSAPADQSEKVAPMPEGSLVRILSQRGRWFYGRLPAGKSGWFLTEGIVPVIPPA